ncbi:MAG: efflux RND transporter periplasmic adaptor subunit [Candidatus Schekmanbacteria bacterium]|nr:efflux RND transporter periplasmic adaptor subunit [Candidatus Schekmanbacteria bacterium]
MTRQTFPCLFFIALLALPAGGCHDSGSNRGSADAAPNLGAPAPTPDPTAIAGEAVPVEIAALRTGRVEAVLHFSANVDAERKVSVRARAVGLVEELPVEEGVRVGSGAVLLRLQGDEQRSAVERVSAQRERQRKELERQRRLHEQDLIPEETIDTADYNLEQLTLELREATRQQAYTTVAAPIAGTIAQRLVNVGDLVTINQVLFEIVDFDSLVAQIFVPDREARKLRLGQQARIGVAGDAASPPTPGKVARIAPVVDPKSGTVKVTVALGRAAALRPGTYIDVELVLDAHEAAVLLPKRAIIYENDQTYVYRLLADDSVERLHVEPLLEDREHIEPAAGFRAGDRIVLAGQAGLKPGVRVRSIRQPDAAATPEAAS